MKLTEKEYLSSNQQLVYRLRNLILTDQKTFHQIKEYLPFPIYINTRNSKTYTYFSKSFFSKGVEVENLYKWGSDGYLETISNPFLLQEARIKAKLFHRQNDFERICNYLQIIKLNGNNTPFFTNKILIDNNYTLNVSLFTSEFQLLDGFIKEFLPNNLLNGTKWSLYQILTKQEKRILKLLTQGLDNSYISDFLSISKHTVVTHRKNIYRKLEVKNVTELIKFSMLLNIL